MPARELRRLNDVAGYVDNVQTGDEDINEGEQETARLAMLWQLNDAISIELSGMMQSIDSDNNASVALDPVTLQPLTSGPGTFLSVDEPFEKDIDYYSRNRDLGPRLGGAHIRPSRLFRHQHGPAH